MSDRCEKCGEDFTTRRCRCMRGETVSRIQNIYAPGPGLPQDEPGRWYPEAEAAALEAVAEAAVALDEAERSKLDDLHEWMRGYRALREAVAALDAARRAS
jgi:hypothetical protein